MRTSYSGSTTDCQSVDASSILVVRSIYPAACSAGSVEKTSAVCISPVNGQRLISSVVRASDSYPEYRS